MASTMTTGVAESENVVVVAVRAEREISKTALAWALTHIVRPGDVVTLLAVLSDHQASGWRQRLLWGFSKLGGNRGSRRRERCPISASCSQMALQIDGRNEINVRIKVVGSEGSAAASSKSVHSGTGGGGSVVVVAESRRVGATWVVLDKELKREEKQCMEELQCNLVVMKGSTAKVLRLNVGGVHNKPLPPFSFSLSSSFSNHLPSSNDHKLINHIPAPPPPPPPPPPEIINKPVRNIVHHQRHHPRQDDVNAAKIKSDHKNPKEKKPQPPQGKAAASYLYLREQQSPLFERSLLLQNGGRLRAIEDVGSDGEGSSEPHTNSSGGGSREASPVSTHLALDDYHQETPPPEFSGFHPFAAAHPHPNGGGYWIPREAHNITSATGPAINGNKNISPPRAATTKTLQERLAESRSNSNISSITEDHSCTSYSTSNVREAVSLIRSSPSVPPPLCSICRHKAPAFGKPPRPFAYRELEAATNGFADESFVAEGPSGCIFRGILEDGQIVAVKQLKGRGGEEASEEFRTEVEVLSRAQHRNVVMLVGFCIHGHRRMMVYEYICNGSMDFHLYDQEKPPVLDWEARVKIAAGVARGLRYLHEDCRVGFVVHKDLRPNNILLTHDFEPLIGDFKLTRWQTETSLSVDTNIPEAFGYLAPEYIEHGIVTDKSDVYAFGVILLELITGRRAMDAGQPKGQQFLAEWARPLLTLASEDGETIAVDRFLDPCLDRDDQALFFSQQLRAMARAASLCLRRDPQTRPGMSKVLRVLEGENYMMKAADLQYFSSVGSRSSRIVRPNFQNQEMSALMPMPGSFSFRFPEENLALLTALSSEKTRPK